MEAVCVPLAVCGCVAQWELPWHVGRAGHLRPDTCMHVAPPGGTNSHCLTVPCRAVSCRVSGQVLESVRLRGWVTKQWVASQKSSPPLSPAFGSDTILIRNPTTLPGESHLHCSRSKSSLPGPHPWPLCCAR